MEAPSMDTVYQAISALYDNPNAYEKEKASVWLGDVQKSIHSWKIADELLQQKKDVHSHYFAAQTMRSKVQHSLSELPADAMLSLRDSLVSHLKATTPETSAAILTQLSLAIADLALQMPAWQNCTSDFINSFSNSNDFALLEILTVLPQEIDSSSLKLGENRRGEIKADLRLNSQIVTQFLKDSITNTQNTNVALKIIKCMTSWITVRAINIQEVPQNAVIGFCLQVLTDHNSINTIHDSAADCICALLHCLEENNNDDSVERLLFDSVSSLENSYHMSVANEEEEKAANYARVFTELAESFLEKIVSCASSGDTHFAMRSLELVLVCVGHHDYEVAEITFNLWYRLSEEVYQRDYAPLTEVFKPHVERLIVALARHCQCEPDLKQLPEEGDEFYDFRTKVMELIKDVVFLVGSSCVFRQMFAALLQHSDASWEQTEAALFVMQAVAKNILPEEYEYVPKVVEAILSMPPTTHTAVRKTCLLLLGELCEWIDAHPECCAPCLQALLLALPEPALSLAAATALKITDRRSLEWRSSKTCLLLLGELCEWIHANPECCAPCLQALLLALPEPTLSLAAATALKSICKSCRGQCAGHVPTLLQAAQQPLPPAAAAALVRALAAAMGRLPPDQLTEAMRSAAAIQLSALSALVKSDTPTAKVPAGDPSVYLDRLAALFRDVEPPPDAAAAAVPALQDAWPLLQHVMDKYKSNGRVMERLCRALRFALRCSGRHCAALLPPLAHNMAAVYTQHAHSCLLYLASILVDELSGEEACVEPLIGLLQALMPRAFQLLQQPGGLRDNPDTVDDLFRLCIRFLQRIPMQFLSSGATAAVLQCATLAAALDHREANSSVMKFLYDVARAANSASADRPRVQVKALADSILQTYGPELTHALMEASVLHLHSYMLSEVAEVLLELLAWQRARRVDWLRAALQRLPRDRPALATEDQCQQFHQYAMKAEKCKEMARLLRDFARLYR